MTYFQALILGIVQGASEFLPISSSGHLVIFQKLLGVDLGESYLAFEILLHIGTLISVLIMFRKDICGMFIAFFKIIGELLTKGRVDMKKSEYRKLIVMLIIATAPLIIGALLENYIENLFTSVLFVGFALLITGGILIATDRFKNSAKTLQTAKYSDAVAVGFAQLIAVLPGISRSGSTIFGGAIMGFSREFAVRFSFLLSMMAILGAAAISIKDFTGGAIAANWGPAVLGAVTAAIVGILAIKWLIRLISKGKSYSILSVYCFIVGLITIITSL
ncbi:MAG: undecaprenyl-diphosphate phosphatase [Clostridiales bacterium]|jgi:undecaprenyl-diphosphatase|nr:undecaprenyl-diphosphate phosphatase [Clostridiales bacterium]